MPTCLECHNKVNRKIKNSSIDCATCKRIFHGKCVNMTSEDIEMLYVLHKKWNCCTCIKKAKKNRLSNADESIIKVTENVIIESDPRHTMQNNNNIDINVSTDDCDDYNLNDVGVNMIDDSVNGKTNTLSDFDVQKEFMALDSSNMESNIKLIYLQLKENSIFFKQLITTLRKENVSLKNRVEYLENRIDVYEQNLLKPCIDMVGVPSCDNEKCAETVLKVLNAGLDVNLNEDSIVKCYRIKENPDKIFVEFESRETKNSIIAVARRLKSISSKVLDATSDNKIYINESLTRRRRVLFNRAKVIKDKLKYKYIWIRDGLIMMRKADGDKIKYVRSIGDLENIC